MSSGSFGFSPDVRRRRPVRADIFGFDHRGTGPLLPGAADADRVTDRLAGADDQIKMPLVGFHHDGAGRVGCRQRHQIAVRLRRSGESP